MTGAANLASSWMHALALFAVSNRKSARALAGASVNPVDAWAEPVRPAWAVPDPPPARQDDGWSRHAELPLAANAGDPEAQYQLGVLGLVGKLGNTGRRKCLPLLQAAADQRHAGACLVLGTLFQHGALVPRDHYRAAVWLRRAADLGRTEAQYNLGLLLLRSHAQADAVEGLKWLILAAAGTDSPIQRLAGLAIGKAALRFGSEDVAEACSHAVLWLQRHKDRRPAKPPAAP